MRKLIYFIPVYIVASLIYYFSSLSYPLGYGRTPGLSGWMLHIMEYSVLSAVVYFAFSKNNLGNKYWNTLLFVLLYAVSDEIHQLFIPGRVGGSITDISMDLIGGIFVVVYGSIL